ncbi:MAG: hypothetical protein HY231_21980 [Acidobacteria bacterium]|nr:hypothetical protein [Acidobacteriota bacterium]
MITQPLADHATLSAPQKPLATGLNDERPRARGGLPWGFIIMFIGVAIGIIGKKFMHEEMVAGLGALVAIAGMFLTVSPSLSPRRKLDASPSAPAEMPSPAHSVTYLPQESASEYVPSITERTTDLLKNSLATRPRQKEDGESTV